MGLILPDLARGLVKKYHEIGEEYPSAYHELLAGCYSHLEDDKKFHASHFFEKGTRVCLEAIKMSNDLQQINRKWFLGHILFEMLMDRLLVKHYPRIGKQFYADLHHVDPEVLGGFLELQGVKETERMLRMFHYFKQSAYILNYTDNNLFGYSLSRVMMRAGLPEISFHERRDLLKLVIDLEENWFAEVYSRIFEMKQIFE
ncbi:MAG: hypothetical protein ACOVP1_04610 [Bacteroidia bacterium]